MTAPDAETITEVADRQFAAVEQGDFDAVDRMWSRDIAVWRTGERREAATPDDKARALRVIGWFITATTHRRDEILDRQTFDDGHVGGFVQQHFLHATGHARQSISMRTCMVIRVGADGLITRIDEYFDPAQIAPLLGDQLFAAKLEGR